MKKIMIALSCLIATNLSQAQPNPPLVFTEVLLKKELKNPYGITFVTYIDTNFWCLKRGTAFDVGSFEAAVTINNLEDGLYRCEGKFARLPYDPIRFFQVDRCVALDPERLKLECEKK